MIRLDGVGKTYPDGTVAVHDLDLDVPRGSVVCLVGPSGCGKSTTVKMVNRLIEPTTGTITLDGRDVTQGDPVELRRHIGYVIQQVGLFPHQTIRTNVATVPSLLGWSRSRATERAEELMELVGLEPSVYADRYPHQLSGGQRQRVGVARALAADPPVLLMDEPFGAVDPVNRANLQDEFLRLQRDLHKTVMLVTHDIDEAVKLGDRVAVFAPGGYLAQYDAPAEVLGRPADDFVAEFVGASRGLRRLSVTPIRREDLEPLVSANGGGASTGATTGGGTSGGSSTAPGSTTGGGSTMPPASSTPPGSSSVPLSASLEEALAAMMRQDEGLVAVTDLEGQVVGVLTPNSIHAALRRSIGQAETEDSGATSPA